MQTTVLMLSNIWSERVDYTVEELLYCIVFYQEGMVFDVLNNRSKHNQSCNPTCQFSDSVKCYRLSFLHAILAPLILTDSILCLNPMALDLVVLCEGNIYSRH